MKSNWNLHFLNDKLRKGKVAVVALLVGLSLGFAGSQVVHSMNESSKEATKVPVHSEKDVAHERRFDFAFPPYMWGGGLLRDSIFRDFDDLGYFPASFENDWKIGCFVSTPRIDTSESAAELRITADVPGIDEKDLEVSVSDNLVTIKGEKKRDSSVSEKDSKKSERFYGTFARSLNLPCRVDSEKAEASLKNGVLTIVIPKSQLAQKECKKLTIRTQ